MITDLPFLRSPVEGLKKILYDYIMTVIDRFTKRIIAVLYHKDISAEELGYLIIKEIVRYGSVLELIANDRGGLFIFNFFKTLAVSLGIIIRLTTVYYP